METKGPQSRETAIRPLSIQARAWNAQRVWKAPGIWQDTGQFCFTGATSISSASPSPQEGQLEPWHVETVAGYPYLS